ncbi:protein transport protein Sec31A isoform X2 [Electrophorus electricus]|uniref:protein transport protein Sec31A isoform X2 n=1 Tax=Electrophorus electricus TaxID=8005 RepID=UPI0015D03E7E|nr:protein transport protein Sec31A isoform X2 [Electrophorus electricus]
MRVKEILRTATQAWSPAAHHPAYLALGTSAQQLDATFNTTAALEIFEMDFADTSMEMKLRGSISTTHRFHSLLWVAYGMGTGRSSGRLIGGGENGTLTVYSPEMILTGQDGAITGQSSKHTGPVRALDYNPFQSNLLASGANDSEIYIWDLNSFSNPMTPGTKSQPVEDVSVVAWNRQVQHILASAGPSGRAVVWDLRKNEPIIKISDHSNRMHCSGMLWHPEVATQVVLASEDDRMPVIQMWDLRFATSPLRVLESHTRGILSVSWSQADPDLLLSSAKDNRILCWNPNTGEIIYELPTANQWCFDVQWCPRNPALLSAASFDGHINVYSVMGGCLEAQQYSTSDKISAAFNTSDPFGTGHTLPPLQVPQPTATSTIIPPLRTPPKWVRRPLGASFAFGGKLVTFENQQPSHQALPRQVYVSQVTTETEFLQRSRELQATLQSGAFVSYCQSKISSAPCEAEQDIWRFLLVNFEEEARVKFLRLLGFSKDELNKKISSSLGKGKLPNGHGLDVSDLAEKMQNLCTQREDEGGVAAGTSATADLGHIPQEKTPFHIPVSADMDGLISQALLVGNFEGAVELCLNDGRYAEAILLSISGGEELLKKTQQRYLNKQTNSISMLISSVVMQNWRDIVQGCELDNWKEALAALLTYANPEDFSALCDILGSRLEAVGTEKSCLQACLCYICSGNIHKLVECWISQKDCSCPLMLEDLVEKVMVLQKSVERLRSSEVTVKSSVLEDKLIQYARVLASQGSLETALSYLPEKSDKATVQRLRERLFHAQGAGAFAQLPSYSKPPTGGASAQTAPATTTNAVLSTPSQGQYPSAVPTQMSQLGQPAIPVIPTTHTPGVPCPTNRPVYPKYPATAPGFPPSQPERAPLGFTTGPNLPPSSLPAPASPQSSAPGLIMPVPVPTMPPLSAPGFLPSKSMPPVPPTSLPGGPVSMFSGITQTQSPAPPPPSTAFPSAGAGYPQGGPGAPGTKNITASAVAPPPTGYFPWLTEHSEEQGAREGWNDPPAIRVGPRSKKVPGDYMPPAPITAPVMSLPADTPLPQDRGQVPPGAPQEPSLQILQQLPAERVEQREIPSEHMILKTTFDSLVQRCQLAATDPQTKRKLDDSSKRISSLYEKLRDQVLSPSILAGLHEISNCMAVRNYLRGLEVHTQVVSSSNFSEISAFMPVLKVLMTIANKLGV